MKLVTTVLLLFLLQACKHPLVIVGEGDIVDLNHSGYGCTLEQSQNGDAACENNVQGDYLVNYTAIPRTGWRFDHWEGSCGHLSEAPNCRFDVLAAWASYWDEIIDVPIPPLTAVFVQDETTERGFEARYDFNQSLDDEGASYPGTNYLFTEWVDIVNTGSTYRDFSNPEPDYGTDGDTNYLHLDWDDFLGFESGVLPLMDLDQPARIDLRFQFHVQEPVVNTSPCCPTAIQRHVLSSNSGDQRDLGFSLQIIKEGEDTYFLILIVGDGRSFLTNNEAGFSEGYRFRLLRVNPDEWISVNFTFKLATPGEERITGFVNGASFTGYLNNPDKMYGPALKRHLEGVVVGRSPDQTYAQFCEEFGCFDWGLYLGQDVGVDAPTLFLGGYPTMETHNAEIDLTIDQLVIQSPVVAEAPEILASLLDDFARHVSGEDEQSDDVLLLWLEAFTGGFAGDWSGIKTSAVAYLEAFAANREPLFPGDLLSPTTFSPEQRLTYFLEQWILDNRFQGHFDDADGGIYFEDSESYPGAVNASAPRLSAAVEVDADYNTDPGIQLNQQETVIRPTGYYAAPGEPVAITVPAAAATAGLKVRIGIQRADMEGGGWVEFNRFPRISSLYDVDATTITVANPFGGGIYFEVPDGSALGVIDVGIDGAVKMPMFSTLDLVGHSDDLTVFTAEADAWNVPWFEMHSRHFSATLPLNEVKLYPDPAAMLKIMDDGFDAIHLMAGRPIQGFRAEWLAYDRWVTVSGTALAASYPIYPNQQLGAVGEYWERAPNYASPSLFLQADFFAPDDPDDSEDSYDERSYNYVLFHEWGHLHNLPTLGWQEQESNVHLLGAVFYNLVMGADIDTALKWSGFQFFDRDQAALDTMFSPNWQEGSRLSEGEMVYGIWDNEVRYQTRSWARLVEIAALYGWEAVGAIHGAFYDRGVAQGSPVNYGLEDDDFIETASAALGMNLAPIFEFWGVPPSAEADLRLQQYPVPAEFETRLLHYRAIAPRTPEDFQVVYDKHAETNAGEVMIRMGYYKDVFDGDMADVIVGRIDDILCRHYGCPDE